AGSPVVVVVAGSPVVVVVVTGGTLPVVVGAIPVVVVPVVVVPVVVVVDSDSLVVFGATVPVVEAASVAELLIASFSLHAAVPSAIVRVTRANERMTGELLESRAGEF